MVYEADIVAKNAADRWINSIHQPVLRVCVQYVNWHVI